jgi:hypothetical protein
MKYRQLGNSDRYDQNTHLEEFARSLNLALSDRLQLNHLRNTMPLMNAIMPFS